MKLKCKRCKKEFDLSDAQYKFLENKSKEMKSELILPKICDDCRLIKEQVKSIPLKIQSMCNNILKKSKDEETNKDIMLIFGLARKQMKENLTAYGFIDKQS